MPKIVFVKPDGTRLEETAPPGETAMKVAVSALIGGIVGECGGDLSCATCHVFVDPQWSALLPPPSEDELDMLEATSEEPTEHSRLACQIICSDDIDGIVITIPESQQ